MSCEHGYPKPTMCTECLMDGPLPPAPPDMVLEVVRYFRAAYSGHCVTCGDDIEPGELIALLSDDSYVHHPLCSPGEGINP